ncbi:phosphate ABC transporter ATP-binding protein [Salinisphaera sp. P385]|uniref:Phosphate ABC transporter ATP-binding protein n=1 Tax=Spectribacter acetivorans TaxID=3075603 RepID=A0ABU3B9H7_9GAMM|nr:phosphate ABC transporter ATP-binding protein [Salinisphaera sp. P385]MDT0618680.1 phosphate ABC transporter ATP-binding protein [Salinisphaera sp. P385]
MNRTAAIDTAREWSTRDATGNPAAAIIETRQLGVRYGTQTALTGVDMQLRRGRITAVIGPSGCGKSSFLTCLNRLTDLIPGCRVDGEIRLDGESISGDAVDLVALRRQVGMIFQKPNPFPLSIARNLDLPLKELGLRKTADRRDRAVWALEQAGLWSEVADRLDAPALSLSGGQQQRLCIARAIALAPAVLLMDEPCSALDPIASERIEALIQELSGRYTVVVVTHNLAQARRIADDTALFWLQDGAGRLIEMGATAQMFEQPRHELTQAYVNGRCC